MEYRYRLGRADWLRWAVTIVGKTQGKGRIIVLTAIMGIPAVKLATMGLERGAFPWADPAWTLFLLPLLLCFPWAVMTAAIYRQSIRSEVQEELVLRLEEDRLILEGIGHREIPLDSFVGHESAGRLLLLKHRGISGEVLYSLLPRRVFREAGEEEHFLEELDRRSGESTERGQEQKEDSPRPASCPPGCYRYLLGEEGLAHMLAVYEAVRQRKEQKGIRAEIFLAAGVFLAAGAAVYWLLSWPGLLIFLLLGFLARLLVGGRACSEQELLERVRAGKYKSMLGEWEADLSGDLISVRINDQQYLVGWKGLKEVLLVEDAYVLGYGGNRMSQVCVPVCALAGENEERWFLERCAAQGLKTAGETVRIPRREKRKGPRGRKVWGLALTAAMLVLAVRWLGSYAWKNQEPVSLEEQRRILEELGFAVPEELMQETRLWMEEEEEYQRYVETTPFYELLLGLAIPEWDPQTWEVTAFSDQAYWFDWEAWDVAESYEEILKGVESLSGNELSFEQIMVDWSGADWEMGTGRVELTFVCNGKPCRMSLEVSNDWLDNSVIRKLNAILARLPGREGDEMIYACDDGGQGAILFYRDKAWAREFEKRTGIRLYFR